MATTSYGFTTPTSNTKLSQFAAVVEDLALKLDGPKLVNIVAGTNLNTLIKPVDYIQAQNANATLALNYPVALGGMLEVDAHPINTMIWQRYTTYASSTTPLPRVFIRGMYPTAGTWSAWKELGESAPAANGFEWSVLAAGIKATALQGSTPRLVYGDTGLRNITSLATNLDDGEIRIRRTLWSVEINFSYLSAGEGVTLLTLPVGYRPRMYTQIFPVWNEVEAGGMKLTAAGVLSPQSSLSQCDSSITYLTEDPWPSANYGNADGTIPYL